MSKDPEHPYASRGGLKLRHALDEFGVDVTGLRCADLGCSVGGFTDCLLQAGAAHVTSVDTAYGQLAWKLRNDDRVEVRERTNALHAEPGDALFDLVVVDLGWTPQSKLLPVVLRWVRPDGRVITLVKPHYEVNALDPGAVPKGGVLEDDVAERVTMEAVEGMQGVDVLGVTCSPVRGSRGKKGGNLEWLVLLGVGGG